MDKQLSLDFLRNQVTEGCTIYTVVRSVSRSGMSRHIDVLMIGPDGRRYLTAAMADLKIGGMRQSLREWEQSKGASIPGCGMDMGFHAVDSLCYKLFGKSMSDCNIRQEWI